MNEFFKKLMDGTNDSVSSKRFVGLVSMGCAILLAIAGSIFDGIEVHYFDGFLMFAAAALAISGFKQLTNNGSK